MRANETRRKDQSGEVRRDEFAFTGEGGLGCFGGTGCTRFVAKPPQRPQTSMHTHTHSLTWTPIHAPPWKTGVPGEQFAQIDRALDERTIGHNPERLNLMKARARAGRGVKGANRGHMGLGGRTGRASDKRGRRASPAQTCIYSKRDPKPAGRRNLRGGERRQTHHTNRRCTPHPLEPDPNPDSNAIIQTRRAA